MHGQNFRITKYPYFGDNRDLGIGQRRPDLPSLSWHPVGVKDACYWNKQLSSSEVSIRTVPQAVFI